MLNAEVDALLAGKGDPARAEIARRVGERLSSDELDEAERRAAEALARVLMHDAIERVRGELSKAVRRARMLPREIAMRIAHDVDSVACPFLEVTEVFSESDWQQLVLTLSRGALVAVARRTVMPESLALSLAQLGNTVVAETLVGNRAAPMTEIVCRTLIDRFEPEGWILDKLAEREDLLVEIALMLTQKVSGAVRAKLLSRYQMPDHTEVIAADAESAVLLGIIRETPAAQLPLLVRALRSQGKLTDLFLLAAARERLTDFLATALSERATMRVEQARSILLHDGVGMVVELFNQSRIPSALHDDFWTAVSGARTVEKKSDKKDRAARRPAG